MPFGLLATGFNPKTLTDIKGELETSFKNAFGTSIDLSPAGPFGELIGIVAAQLAELWDIGQALYSADDPDGAIGNRLIQLAAITGTIPQAATRSQVTLTCTGVPGTVLPAGRTVSVDVTLVVFETLTEITFVAAGAWDILITYDLNDHVTNNGNIYTCIQAGVGGGGGGGLDGPETEDDDITTGTAHWRFLGNGTGYNVVVAAAQLTGPIVALSGTCANIESPVFNWSSVTNFADATLGLAADTDSALRTRRENELPGQARSTLDSIRTRILEDVTGVTTVYVFQNITDAVLDGMPPHSVEALVVGGDDQDIIDTLFANVAAGIATTGNTTGTYTDTENADQTYDMAFSRPDELDVYTVFDVEVDLLHFPSDGVAQIKTALLAYGVARLVPGKNVVANALAAQVFGITGVLEVTPYIGLAPAPATMVTIPVAVRELALLDSARITVNVSYGTP